MPNSYSRKSTTFSPRWVATSRAPAEMNWVEGNLLVTMATVLGGLDVAARASKTVAGTVLLGSGPKGFTEKCISYLARCGMPNELWISIFW